MSNLQNIFQGRSFLACHDYTPAELNYLIDFALHLKELKKRNIPHPYLQGKNIALLFEKASTRTRSAFVVACHDLGAHPEYMGAGEIHLGKKESIADTAKVLGRMFDGIEYRGFAHQDVETLAKYAGVPVWNGLTDKWHPTQMLADFMTIKEKFGYLRGLTLAYVGDGRDNVADSLLVAGTMLGVNVHIVTPRSLFTHPDIRQLARKYEEITGARPLITDKIAEGVKKANVVYTDVWVSMGEEDWTDRIKLLRPYQVNMKLMKETGTPADQLIFMHCLPAFHDTHTDIGQKIEQQFDLKDMEVTDEVFRSPYAWQFTEAENRMHSIKALMAATLGNLFIPYVQESGPEK